MIRLFLGGGQCVAQTGLDEAVAGSIRKECNEIVLEGLRKIRWDSGRHIDDSCRTDGRETRSRFGIGRRNLHREHALACIARRIAPGAHLDRREDFRDCAFFKGPKSGRVIAGSRSQQRKSLGHWCGGSVVEDEVDCLWHRLLSLLVNIVLTVCDQRKSFAIRKACCTARADAIKSVSTDNSGQRNSSIGGGIAPPMDLYFVLNVPCAVAGTGYLF